MGALSQCLVSDFSEASPAERYDVYFRRSCVTILCPQSYFNVVAGGICTDYQLSASIGNNIVFSGLGKFAG